MLDDVTLCCSATISPALVALIKGVRGPVRGDPVQDNALGANPVQTSPMQASLAPVERSRVEPCGPPPTRPDWVQVSLRRDGRRPVRDDTLLVWAHEDRPVVLFAGGTVAIYRRLSVYVTRTGDVLVHLRHQPPDGYPARPIYRVFRPRDAQDLSRSLRNNGPELCFDVSAQTAVCQGTDGSAQFPSPVTT